LTGDYTKLGKLRDNRRSGLRLKQALVKSIREDKAVGLSLKEVALRNNVSANTVSTYCRDLFWHPHRIYQTEEDVRAANQQHNIDNRHPCKLCGKLVWGLAEYCWSCEKGLRQIGSRFCSKCGHALYFRSIWKDKAYYYCPVCRKSEVVDKTDVKKPGHKGHNIVCPKCGSSKLTKCEDGLQCLVCFKIIYLTKTTS